MGDDFAACPVAFDAIMGHYRRARETSQSHLLGGLWNY
jgi:hypothetical protein